MPRCPPGKVYDTCSYTCDQACDFLRMSTLKCTEGNCVPGCRDVTAQVECGPGEKKVDADTCVPTNMCPCLKPDGTVAQVSCLVFRRVASEGVINNDDDNNDDNDDLLLRRTLIIMMIIIMIIIIIK